MSYSNSVEGFLRDSDGVVTVKRVLLIEGHALFRQGLALLLNWELGLESIDAGSLAEGHRVLGAAKGMADLAIIELDLPDGDGSELIERLHQTEPDVPIVAFSADRSLARRWRWGRTRCSPRARTSSRSSGRRWSSSARMGRGWREDEEDAGEDLRAMREELCRSPWSAWPRW
jgi:CheY-like chemotaxis protein